MIDLAAIYFGIFLGVFPLTLVKIARQTRKIIAQSQSRSWQNAYLYMIWIEALVNFVFALVTFLYLTDVIHGNPALYYGTGKATLTALSCCCCSCFLLAMAIFRMQS